MIEFASQKELFDWMDERERETLSTRQERAHYANRNRARYNGIQWISRASGMNEAVRLHYNLDRDWGEVYQQNESMRTTVNRTTAMIQQGVASTNWTGMEVVAQPSPGSPGQSQYIKADLAEIVANIVVDFARFQNAAERANLERAIDGFHGIGFRLQKSDIDGTTDFNLQAFDFDGYQLTLDPTNRSLDLRDHEYVMLTEIKTWYAAKREYGDLLDQINEDDLQSLAQLMPNEVAHMALSSGTMYTHLRDSTHLKAVRIKTLWVRGRGKRFDRMYVIVDGVGRAGKVAINFQNPGNPYGGVGLPIQCFHGYMRPGEIFGISDVGMVADDQDKLNLAATLYWQQVFDFTTNVVYAIDKGWFGNSRIDETEVIEKVRQGYIFGNTNGVARFNPPQIISRPPPNQQLLGDMQAHERGMRGVMMQTDLHSGSPKTHIADSTHQLTVELAEAPVDDRRERDIRAVSALLEVATGTMVSMVRAQAPSAIAALEDGGMNATQIAGVMDLDPYRLPAKLNVTRESVRRRSKGQMKRDLLELAQTGAHQDPFLRTALAALDFPVVEVDKDTERWANRMVSRVIEGEPWTPIPLGALSETALEALRRGMRSDEADDPEVWERLMRAYQQQMQMDLNQGMVPLPGDEEEPLPDSIPMDQAQMLLG